MRAVLPDEVTLDWGHFLEIFGRFSSSSFGHLLEMMPRAMVNGITVNSWELCSSQAMGSEWAVLGCGLYLGPSILNHSCVPTAKVQKYQTVSKKT